MSRSFEFSIGATYKQRDMDGNEIERNAVESAGGVRGQGNQAGMLPPVEIHSDHDPWYGAAGTMQGPDFEYEKRWSQSYDDNR